MVAYTYLLALLAATAAVANPTPIPNEDVSLEARAGQIYICSGLDKAADKGGKLVKFGEISQDRAIGFFRDAKTKKGGSGYPTTFSNKNNVMKFASGCSKDVWELPVLANGKPYAFNQKNPKPVPGPMRVYYTKDLKFCGIGAKEVGDPTVRSNPKNCVLKK